MTNKPDDPRSGPIPITSDTVTTTGELIVYYGLPVQAICAEERIYIQPEVVRVFFARPVAVYREQVHFVLARLTGNQTGPLRTANLTLAYQQARQQGLASATAHDLLALVLAHDKYEIYRDNPVVALDAVLPGFLPARCETAGLRNIKYLCAYRDAAGTRSLGFRLLSDLPSSTQYLFITNRRRLT